MVVAAGRTLTADYPLRDSGVRARGELEVPLTRLRGFAEENADFGPVT